MLNELINNFTLSVSQLNEYANRLLMSDELLQGVLVSGEVSNYHKYPSGHWYFSLKDEQSSVKCVMFKQNNRSIPFDVTDGMHITVGGYASIYLRDGSFQLYVQTMQSEGAGVLYERFEKLKNSLAEKGLFDSAHKKRIPRFPKRIGVVTSSAGAVIRDIIEVSKRRNPNVDILLVPVSVQGKTAATEIAKGIETLNRRDDIDVIIIGRGGGSMEDLWAFNEEAVAYAIHQSRVPIISAVGHETDTTISDYVADLRAPTPSAAAELAVPLFDAWVQFVDIAANRMQNALTQQMAQRSRHLQALLSALSPARMNAYAMLHERHLAQTVQRIGNAYTNALQNWTQRILLCESKLQAYSVQAVLERGYALVLDESTGKAIGSAEGLVDGQSIRLLWKDGQAKAGITDVFRQEDKKYDR